MFVAVGLPCRASRLPDLDLENGTGTGLPSPIVAGIEALRAGPFRLRCPLAHSVYGRATKSRPRVRRRAGRRRGDEWGPGLTT